MSTNSAVRDERLGDAQLNRLAAAIVMGAVAVILDTTIVSVALDQLGSSLGADLADIQWVSTAYLLAMVVAIPVSSWAQAKVGGRRLWLAALALFLLGSVLCAVSWDLPSLVVSRVVQGLGGGVMMPLMTTLLMQAAGGRPLGGLMAKVSLPAALGPILGPVVGGLILSAGSWRWIFAVNVPLCLVGLALAYRWMPRDRPCGGAKLDIIGLVLLSPGIALVVYGLSEVGSQHGFGHAAVLVPLLVGVALCGAFVAWARQRGSRALVDVTLFRHRPLAASTLLLVVGGAVLYGAMFLLPLYYQQVRGLDALGAGLIMIPQGLGALASRRIAGRLTDTIGARWVSMIGFLVIAVATVPFALADANTSEWFLGAVLVIRGLGVGAVFIPLMTGAFAGLTRDEMPHASIFTRVGQQLGGSFGIAVLAVVLTSLASSGMAGGFDGAFWWAVGIAVAAVPLSLLLPAADRAQVTQ